VFSCKKEKSLAIQTPPPPPPPPPSLVLLKDIAIPGLPSPYYHFEYSDAGKITVASFASDFKRYEVDYADGRISEMKNNIGGLVERLQYVYDNSGKVIAVNCFDLTGVVSLKFFLTYDGQQLIKVERQRKLGSAFVVNKTMTFSYYADGNLKEIIDHRPAINGQVESTTRDQFVQYDNKVNVDGFSLLHNDFFDQLVLLPGVQLQKNNPGTEIFISDGTSYQVSYTYTYNSNDLPLTKTGNATVTAGTGVGQTFQTNSEFTYY
jgi:hypothetical protein